MLSICNVGARQAGAYYEKDGYYARMSNEDHRWYGRLQADLGLPDQVEKADFDRLVLEREERVGFDLCFSAPKSVSIAMCLDEPTRQTMVQAHNQAVEAVLSQIEAAQIGARVTKNRCTEYQKTGNMICGRFNHYVSRAHDPQLHTHCVILNKTKSNGKYYAIDNPTLYHNKIINGQLYRNALARELLSRGYEISVTNYEKGFFELTGIAQESIDHFSSRRRAIVDKLKEWNVSEAVAASQAALTTRNAKTHKDLSLLMRSWHETITEMGGVALKKTLPVRPDQEQVTADFAKAVKQMTRKQFAFTETSFKRMALAYGVGSGMTASQFQELFENEIGKDLICLGQQFDGKDKQIYYCTRKNYELEQAIFQEITRGQATMDAVSLTKAQDYLAQNAVDPDGKLKLSSQQRDAVLFMATNKDQFIAIQGLAGTGKTYLMDYARQVLEADGFEVKGACFTGKAANCLQSDAHIPSVTLHSFLNALEKEAGHSDLEKDYKNKAGWNLQGLKPSGRKEVWVVDEASMVDNVALRHLVEAAKLKNAKVCLMGDRQQLLPVGIGNAFGNLVENQKIACVTLDEIRRQKDSPGQLLLHSVKEAVLGDVSKSFASLEELNAVHNIAQRRERFEAIVNEFTALSKEQRDNTVILTAGNKDRMALNKKLRYQLQQQGELKAGVNFTVRNAAGTTYRREFAVGEKLIFLQNDQKVGVRNGQTGFIDQINGNVLTVRSGQNEQARIFAVNVSEYNYLDHGYVLTSHKAQGITEDRVIINLDTTQTNLNSRNSYYVDISRARFEVKLFTDNSELLQEQVKEFAAKLTSDNFLIPTESGKLAECPRTNLPQYCKSIFDNINNSIQQFRSNLKTLDMGSLPGIEKFLANWNHSKQPEKTKNGPDLNC
jgi:conjugative relaxase-like TrwC/TraI family protein